MNCNDQIKDNLANEISCYDMYVKLKPGRHFTPECWEGYMVNTVQVSDVAYIICKRETKKESDPDHYFMVKPENRQIQATI